MEPAHFPWRPLGDHLVAGGHLTSAELEQALAEQRQSGRLLGQVLVRRGYIRGPALALALAEQHGVALRVATPPAVASEPPPDVPARPDRPWRPLGRVLVELGLVTETDLAHVLAAQERQPTRRIGVMLVSGGYVSGRELALALAEQHGVELVGEDELGDELETVLETSEPDEPTYRVYTVAYEPAHRPDHVLYQSASLLDAADFACDFIQRERPAALEIEKVAGASCEPVWTYSEARANAEAAARKNLVEVYGFNPVRWDTGSQLDWKPQRAGG